MIKVAILDLDGTLVDSMPYWRLTPLEFARSKNIEPDDNLSDIFLSMSLFSFSKYYKELHNLSESIDEIMSEIDSIMEGYYLSQVKVKEGIIDLLEMFSKNNVKIAVATQTDKPLTKMVLDKLGLGKYVSFIITSGEVGSGKSDPKIYIECAKHFNAKNAECIVVEDLPYGIESSGSVGFTTIGIYDEPSKAHQDRIKKSAKFYFEVFDKASINDIEKFIKNCS